MKTRLRQTTIVSLACLAFLAGLIFGRGQLFPLWPVLAAAALTILLWPSRLRPLMIAGLFLVLGLWRAGQINLADSGLNQQMSQKVTFVGTIKDDPALSDKNQLSFAVSTSTLNGHPYKTSVNVYTYRLPVRRGYRVAINGKLKPARGASQSQISFPTLQILSDHLSWLEKLRLKFFAAVRTAVPEPMASFALGLLVGARALIPPNLQTELSIVGLSHLVAVSGYNLTILVNAARRLFRRFGKFTTLALSLWLIATFVVIAGASASIVRAAVVSVMTLVAAYFGRKLQPVVLILLAAALTAGINPHSMWSDLGWQLSFAAFAGILILAPALSDRFGGRKHVIVAMIAEALAAYVTTLPIILHSFGTLGPIAPIINVVVMPLVPLAMLFSFMAGLAAMFIPVISGWLAWPANLSLRFMIGLIEQTARIHAATVMMPVPLLVIWYALLGLIVLALLRSQNRRSTCYNSKEEETAANVRTLKVV